MTDSELDKIISKPKQGADVPLGTLEPGDAEKAAVMQSWTYGPGTIAKARFQETFTDTGIESVKRKWDVNRARNKVIDNPILSVEEATKTYGKYGLKFDKPIKKQEAELLAKRKIEALFRQEKIAKSESSFLNSAASLVGAFAGAMVDPVGIAASFIPVTKVVPVLNSLRKAGVFGRVAYGAIDGLIGNAILEPLPLLAANIDQRDYTMTDSLFNIVAGGVFGGGIGALSAGVRLLAPGEALNANKAAITAMANGKDLSAVKDFQAKAPIATQYAFDDIMNMPDDILSIKQAGNNVSVSLKDDGALGSLRGYGKTLDGAKISLRKQLGAVLDNQSIFDGYRLDDAIDTLVDNLRAINALKDMSWLAKLEKQAVKAGVSFEEFLAKRTNNFTDFSKITNRAKSSNKKRIKYGEVNDETLDLFIDQGADELTVITKIKEAFNNNPKQQMSYDTFLYDMGKQAESRSALYDDFLASSDEILARQIELENLQKQLDTLTDMQERTNLISKIDELNASIKDQQNAIDNFLRENDIDLWKAEAENLDGLERVREQLSIDTRNFSDAENAINQAEETNMSAMTDIADLEKAEKVLKEPDLLKEAELAEEANSLVDLLQTEVTMSKLSKDELSALGFTKEGKFIDAIKADKKLQETEDFIKDIDNYTKCRITEG